MSVKEKIKEELPEEFKNKPGAQAEQFITNHANGNGINPNPTEDGNAPEWEKGTQQNEQYKSDSLKE